MRKQTIAWAILFCFPALAEEVVYINCRAAGVVQLRGSTPAKVKCGEQVTLISQEQTWALIRTSGGKEGYLSLVYISKTKPEGVPTIPDSLAPAAPMVPRVIEPSPRPEPRPMQTGGLPAQSSPTRQEPAQDPVPAAPPVAIAQPQNIAGIKIPEGTKIRVRLEQTLSSATAEKGQPVQMSVVEDVSLDDAVVISQGASVSGTVIQAVPKRRMGRTGKLDFSAEHVTAMDGRKVPLRYSVSKREGGGHGLRTGLITGGVALVFLPAAPFFLLMKGKDTTINKGVTFEVFTDQDHTLRGAGTTPAAVTTLSGPAPLAAPASGGKAEHSTVTIKSDPDGAEIVIAGKFVGNTPSTLRLPAGDHEISVEKSGHKPWKRAVSLSSGGTITIEAVLQKIP